MNIWQRTCFLCLVALALHWQAIGQATFPPEATVYTSTVYSPPSPGYIFISPAPQVPVFNEKTNLMLLDSNAQLIWYAPLSDGGQSQFQTVFAADFKELGNGTMSFFRPGPGGGKFYILDSAFALVDSVWCNGISRTDAHDLHLDANGNYTLICDSAITADASGLTTNSGIQGSPNASVSYQIVQQQDPGRNVLWNWGTLDHIPITDSDTAQFTSPSLLDHTHMNSIWLDEQGGIVVSSRNLNEITRFDPLTGAIKWRFGGKGNQFTLTGDTEFFSAQHDANFSPDGHLYLFDNGSVGAHRVARYLEYVLDTVSKSAVLLREHRHPNGLLSRYMGNALLLPDGHAFVSWGGVFPEDSTVDVTEFLPDGSTALEIDLPGGFFSYRAHKQSLNWTLPRPQISCDAGPQTLTAPAGHGSYWWNTGETTQQITVSAPGAYQVWVDQGIGFIASEKVVIWDVNDICLALEGVERTTEDLLIGPNPSAGILQVWLPEKARRGWQLEVRDALGRCMYTKEGNVLELRLDLGGWPSGIYFIEMQSGGQSYRKRILRP